MGAETTRPQPGAATTNDDLPPPRPDRSRSRTGVLEDIAAHGLPDPEQCTPWEDPREAHLARLAAQRPAVT
ncbi:hypothetical protein [Streptomyces sp. enrichment culture]|uniref:hypothetical protein n=1 Tax=Streptomyces sp. enrichment culture TaxID=1795815 RepID=UPI003F57212D